MNLHQLMEQQKPLLTQWSSAFPSPRVFLPACLPAALLLALAPLQAATLDVTDGLAMRLESIDGVLDDGTGMVSDWIDLTGNGHNASQFGNASRRPLLALFAMPSGAPALRFDGVEDVLTLAGQVVSSQDFSIFVVANATPASSGNMNLFGNWSSAAGNFQTSLFIGLTGYQADTDSSRVRFTDIHQLAGIVPHVSRHFVLDFVTDQDPAGPGSAVVTHNGITLFTGEDLDALGGRNLTSNPDTAPYVIGVQGDPDHGGSAGEFWKGDIAAILVYDRALTSAEQAQVRQYLQDTYLEPVPPTLESINPPADAIVADLRSITLVFDEGVTNVDAGDLLINDVAVATNVVAVSAREYTFQFPQVPLGPVNISFASNHGITDLASTPNAFVGTGWAYIRVDDATPPTVEISEPAAGSTVSGLNFITVVFDEDVTGVTPGDLLINGSAIATNLFATSPRAYTFLFPEPAFGEVSVGFAADHGITDLAAIPNPFAGTTWTLTLSSSAPLSLVVQRDLAMWLESNAGVTNDGTDHVSGWADQSGNGHDAFQANPDRRPLWVAAATATGAGVVRFDGIDDLFTLVGQVVHSQDFSMFAVVNATPGNDGNKNLFGNWSSAVGRYGTALYMGITGYATADDSARVRFTDIAANAGSVRNIGTHFLIDFITDNDLAGPGSAVVAQNGAVIYSGEDLDAQGGRDLGANPTNAPYVIGVQGDPDHIEGGWSAGEYWPGDVAALLVYDRFLSPPEQASVRQYLMETYVARDEAAPTLVSVSPPAGVTAKGLTAITVIFDESVRNVNANDLLINGAPIATNLVVLSPSQYTFQFPQPAPGILNVSFAPDHGITDLAYQRNLFAGAPWTYTLDPNATVTLITDGLAMQLEATMGVTADASGLVSDWEDSSFLGHDAFQANPDRQPTLVPGATPSGAPALRFDGTNDLLTLSGQVIFSQSFCVFAVVDATPRDGGSKNLFGNWAGSVGRFGSSVFLGLAGYQAGADSATVRFTDVHTSAGTARNVGQHFVLDFVTDNEPDGVGLAAVYQNGTRLFAGGDLGVRDLSANADDSPYTLGAQGDPDHGWTAGEYWTGDVAALLVYDRFLDDSEQFAVRQYLHYTYLVPVAGPELLIRRVELPGGGPGVRVSWPQAEGTGFNIQSATAVQGAAWSDLASTTEGDEFVVYEPLTGSAARFYRLLKQ